jgi:hypothetical protein
LGADAWEWPERGLERIDGLHGMITLGIYEVV